jgi:hypothetical protein
MEARSEPAKNLERTSEVELCDSRKDHEANVEISHASIPT